MKQIQEIRDNVFIDFIIIKDIVADIVRKTAGVAEVHGFLSKTINADNNIERVIEVTQNENGILDIRFAIGIKFPHLIFKIPLELQNKIYNSIKYVTGIESKIHIYVSKISE